VETPASAPIDTVVLDIDGTLLDSVYAHVWSWREAFRVLGVEVPTWRIHRAIGMGGDRLVGFVTNDAVEVSIGGKIRSRQSDLYHDLATHLIPTTGATCLLETLKARGLLVVLASSGSGQDTENAVALLEARRWVDATISADDTDATKPDTEPVQRAVASVQGGRALVIGDATWDVQAASRAGYVAVGLLTGGIAKAELLQAGALEVYDDPAALTSALDDVLAMSALATCSSPEVRSPTCHE
jgi:phosphoglycolate phosphatase-like HAD superfamily hydrolase